MPAATLFHPWLRELALGARNGVAHAARQPGETLFVGVAWLLLLGFLAWAWSHVDGDRFGVVLEAVVAHPAPLVVVLAALALGAVRAAVVGVRDALADGWWSAMPVPVAATRRTLVLVGLATALLQATLLGSALLALALVSDEAQRWFGPALRVVVVACALGAVPGIVLGLRAPPRHVVAASDRGRGVPVLPLAAVIERGPLGEAARWQRVEGLRRWRAGGGAWQLGVFALLIPANEGRATLAGLLLLGLAAVWGAVTLRAALDVTARFAALSAALPRRFGALVRATARYPAAIVLATSAWLVLALALQDAPAPFLVAAPLLLAALVLHELALTWRYTRDATRARRRFAVELVLLVGVAQVLGLLTVALYLAFVVKHLLEARHAR